MKRKRLQSLRNGIDTDLCIAPGCVLGWAWSFPVPAPALLPTCGVSKRYFLPPPPPLENLGFSMQRSRTNPLGFGYITQRLAPGLSPVIIGFFFKSRKSDLLGPGMQLKVL